MVQPQIVTSVIASVAAVVIAFSIRRAVRDGEIGQAYPRLSILRPITKANTPKLFAFCVIAMVILDVASVALAFAFLFGVA